MDLKCLIYEYFKENLSNITNSIVAGLIVILIISIFIFFRKYLLNLFKIIWKYIKNTTNHLSNLKYFLFSSRKYIEENIKINISPKITINKKKYIPPFIDIQFFLKNDNQINIILDRAIVNFNLYFEYSNGKGYGQPLLTENIVEKQVILGKNTHKIDFRHFLTEYDIWYFNQENLKKITTKINIETYFYTVLPGYLLRKDLLKTDEFSDIECNLI